MLQCNSLQRFVIGKKDFGYEIQDPLAVAEHTEQAALGSVVTMIIIVFKLPALFIQ